MCITSGFWNADEELLWHELGPRVANAIVEFECTGWDALMDACYGEYCQNHKNDPEILEISTF